MFGWLKKKSGEHQLRNAKYGLAKVIAAANVIEQAWAAKREPTPDQVQALNRAKGDLLKDMAGPLPPAEIRRLVIDPGLAAPGVTDAARTAVIHTYEYLLSSSQAGSGYRGQQPTAEQQAKILEKAGELATRKIMRQAGLTEQEIDEAMGRRFRSE